MPKIIIPTRCDRDENLDCDCAVADVTEGWLADLQKRAEWLLVAYKQDTAIYEVYFWGGQVDYYDDILLESAASDLNSAAMLRYLGFAFAPKIDSLVAQRTECHQTVLRITQRPCGHEDSYPIIEVSFFCYPKHCDAQITTKSILLDTLVSRLRELET